MRPPPGYELAATSPSLAAFPYPRRRSRRSAVLAALLALVLAAFGLSVLRSWGISSFSTFLATWSSSAAAGAHGSIVNTSDGTQFVYSNPNGGHWATDGSARAQKYTPSLLEPWDFDSMRIAGVNLGGWLVTEPFITPSLFDSFLPLSSSYPPAIDEYDLCVRAGDTFAEYLTTHYATFITEHDFAQIAGAGLNWVRLPIPFWMIETWPGECYLEGVSFDYLIRALSWARKYGIRVLLDLHSVPGSQNGWNHSGKSGHIGWLTGRNGIVNAERTLNYLATLSHFIARDPRPPYGGPSLSDIVPAIAIVNEPRHVTLGEFPLRSFYYQAYNRMRTAYQAAPERSPMIVLFDGFFKRWKGFLTGADRVALDLHLYQAFSTKSNVYSIDHYVERSCTELASRVNRTTVNFGLSFTGEWSLARNDCGDYINGVGLGSRYEGSFIDPNPVSKSAKAENNNANKLSGDCSFWNDAYLWDDKTKADFQDLFISTMDAAQNSFYWTWRTGNSSITGRPANPMWNYQLGLELGYISRDAPRYAKGICQDFATKYNFSIPSIVTPKSFRTEQTHYLPNSKPQEKNAATYGRWPPAYLLGPDPIGDTSTIPRLTPTGMPILLVPSLSAIDDPQNIPPPFPPSSSPAHSSPDENYNDYYEPPLPPSQTHEGVQLGEIVKAEADIFPFGWYTKIDGCEYPLPYDEEPYDPSKTWCEKIVSQGSRVPPLDAMMDESVGAGLNGFMLGEEIVGVGLDTVDRVLRHPSKKRLRRHLKSHKH